MNDEQIFARAVQLTGHERKEFIAQSCGQDPVQRDRMEKLLAAHETPDSLLAVDCVPSTTASANDDSVGEPVGPYKLLQKLGEGGMGAVYLAERQHPVKQRVALKIIKYGMDSKKFVARFEAERQALAMMDHPNIASVHDAGCTQSGRPYLVMELVKGVPITTYCDQNKLSTRERLELFIPVCHAVQHAHRKGIIHRDLKPSNIMVAMYDDKPVVKVIDFGLAKAANQQLTDKTLFTEVGSILGTWEYMSPEQAVLNQLDVDTRTDVYALGVILYELLTGATPLDRKQLREVQLRETLRIIQEVDPPKPSTRVSGLGAAVSAVATYRSTDAAGLSKSIRGDLDWVTMKALEKDRRRRYEAASRLADDVAHVLAGEAVDARPPSLAYTTSKLWNRHKLPISAAALVLCSLVIASIAFIFTSSLLLEQRQMTKELSNKNEKLVTQEGELTVSRNNAEKSLYAATMHNAMTAWERNDVTQMNSLLAKYDDSPLRCWEWYFLRSLSESANDPILAKSVRPMRIALSPDNRTIAVSHAMGPVASIVKKGESRVVEFGKVPSGVFEENFVEFSPAGDQFLHSDDRQESVVIREATTHKELDRLRLPPEVAGKQGKIRNAVFSHDDACIYMSVKGVGLVRFQRDATPEYELLYSEPNRSTFVPIRVLSDGRVAFGADDVHVIDPNSGKLQFDLKDHRGVQEIVEVVEQDWLITAGKDHMLMIWDAEDGKKISSIGPVEGEIRALAYNPATRRLAAGCRNRVILQWELPDFEELESLRGYNAMHGLCFDQAGALIYGAPNGLRNTANHHAAVQRVKLGQKWISRLRFDASGKNLIVNPRYQPEILVINVQDGTTNRIPLPELTERVQCSSRRMTNNSVLAIAERDCSHVVLFDYLTESVVSKLAVPSFGRVTEVEFSHDFESLMVGFENGKLVEIPISSESSEPIVYEDNATGQILEISCRDDRSVITGDGDGHIDIWADRRRVKRFGPYGGWINHLDCRPSQIALGVFGLYPKPSEHIHFGTIGSSIQGIYGHTFGIAGVKFIENGETLITMGSDREIKLWDTNTLETRISIRDREIYSAMAVSPDESIIAAGTREGSVILYRANLP